MSVMTWALPLDFSGAPPVATEEQPESSRKLDEGELLVVRAAREGDEASFRVLVDRYRDRVYALAMRIAKDSQAAEEIAQDTFVRAWQALALFRGDSRFSTWLYRIAFRRALDEKAVLDRRRGRELQSDADVDSLRDLPVPSAGDFGLRRKLERLVSQLPESQRIALTLFYGADQSIEEIGKVLDVPSGTVKTHLHRGRAELRALWERERNVGSAS
jgi:RNA polymerase sigma-70 factor (ECF subfamily)